MICETDNEVSESESFQAEQSHKNSDLGQVNSLEVSVVSKEQSNREESLFLERSLKHAAW